VYEVPKKKNKQIHLKSTKKLTKICEVQEKISKKIQSPEARDSQIVKIVIVTPLIERPKKVH
jgi:hypothetical protein